MSQNLAKKDMVLSCADGSAYSMMVGCGETYIAAFALAVGMGQIAAGLVGTIPLMLGGFIQLLGPFGAKWCGSYRRWVVICASLQGVAFLPMAYGALSGTMNVYSLFATCAIYWGFGMSAGPAWNSWIDRIVPKEGLRTFFTIRARLTQLAAFLAFLGAGYTLVIFQNQGRTLTGFATLFAVAAVWRLISCVCLRLQSDAPVTPASTSTVSLLQISRRLYTAQSSRFLVFLLASQVGVHIGGAFFASYMLAHAAFPYHQYVALIGICYLAKIVMLPVLSSHLGRLGSYRTLVAAAIGVSPLPLTWFLLPDFHLLLIVQFFAGMAWAAFELSSTLLIFERIPGEERLAMLTAFNLLNAAAVVLGSLIGSIGIKLLPESLAYPVIFSISAMTRLAATWILWKPRRSQLGLGQASGEAEPSPSRQAA